MTSSINKAYVAFHLREAFEELNRMLQEVENDPEWDHGDFIVEMSHLYHHLNTAWNARDASQAAVDECSEEDYLRWRRMPTDLLL